MTRKTGIVASGVLLSVLLACQPAPLTGAPATGPGTTPVVSLGAPNGASITISMATNLGMSTKALPKGAADVVKYLVTLHDNATNVQIGGTLSINGPTTTGQFVGVPAGTYYIKANAFDDALATNSIVQGGNPIQSINTVTVAGGVATYSGGQTSLVVNLPLLDGTVGTGSSNISVASRTTGLAGADKSGLSLWNGATRRATPNPVNPSITYALSNVQIGNKSGTAQTHEIWAFAVNTGLGTASMPKPFGTGANVSGNPSANVTVTHSATTVESAAGGVAVTVAAGHRLQLDSTGNAYYYDGTNIRQRQVGGNYTTDVLALDNSAGAITGFAVSHDANLFFSTGTDIKLSAGTVATGAMQAVTAANVGKMAIDEARCIYYVDTVTNKIRRCVFTGTAFQAPVDVASPATPSTMLAADSYGSVYYSDGTDIYKCALGTDETTYAVPAKVVTAAGVTSFCVDRVGNITFTDGGNAVKFVGAGETTIYTTVGPGTGVGADVTSGAAPTATNLNTPNAVAVNNVGRLVFTSRGAVNRFLRYVQ